MHPKNALCLTKENQIHFANLSLLFLYPSSSRSENKGETNDARKIISKSWSTVRAWLTGLTRWSRIGPKF